MLILSRALDIMPETSAMAEILKEENAERQKEVQIFELKKGNKKLNWGRIGTQGSGLPPHPVFSLFLVASVSYTSPNPKTRKKIRKVKLKLNGSFLILAVL